MMRPLVRDGGVVIEGGTIEDVGTFAAHDTIRALDSNTTRKLGLTRRVGIRHLAAGDTYHNGLAARLLLLRQGACCRNIRRPAADEHRAHRHRGSRAISVCLQALQLLVELKHASLNL